MPGQITEVGPAERLRSEFYNASALNLHWCHEELMILRVQPDAGVPVYLPGQYTVLGLGYWEPRLPGCQEEGDISRVQQKLIKRAYSVSSPLLDEAGQLIRAADPGWLEFYISLVRKADEHPPALTPRLFALQPGGRLYCGLHMQGHYTLTNLPPEGDVVFAATGTGEAPHNAMLGQLLGSGHRGRIVNLTCVRWRKDLGYLTTHRRLEATFPNYRYIALTTREPENLEASRPDYVGRRYLQDYFESGDLASDTGLSLDPARTHVFLCGHPDMIGVPLRTHDATRRYPQPRGLVEILETRYGFQIDRPHEPGNIHFEKYW